MGSLCSTAEQEVYEEQDEQAGDVEELLANDEFSTVVITISCRGLVHSGMRKPDPKVYVYEVTDQEKTPVSKTETISSSNSPQFVQTINVVYQFGTVQILRFEVVHEEKRGGVRDEQRLIGYAELKLSTLLERTGAYTEPLKGISGNKTGDIILKAEETKKSDGPEHEVIFRFGCKAIDSKNVFGAGSSDPFLEISNVRDGGFAPVARSEYIEGVTGCMWKPIVVKLDKLCGRKKEDEHEKNYFNSVLLFEVYDWEASGKHQIIGSCKSTLADMLAAYEGQRVLDKEVNYELINATKQGKEAYENSGILILKSVEVETSHSFLEYVRGGFDINLTICVDFSLSNGNCRSIDSLHYMDETRRLDNEYVKALRAVVKVLGEYDKDQEFPFYGFGAREISSQDPTPSNIFPVTFDVNQVEVNGIDGLVDAYWKCLNKIEMLEPSNFSSCMQKALAMAASSNKQAYQIVLFITDGQISDLQSTVDVIVECATEPISVLVIGVGSGPFGQMEYLDGDEKPLVSSDGKMPNRDLVGFVPYQDYKNDPTQLARETLKEIPRQFTQWAKLHKVKPPERNPEEEALALRMAEQKSLEREKKAHAEALQRMNGLVASAGQPEQDEPPTHVTLSRKSVSEPLGLELSDLTIAGVTPGTAAERDQLDMYEGFMITHVNGAPVYKVEDIGPLIKNTKAIEFTLVYDRNFFTEMPTEQAPRHTNKSRRHRRHHHRRDSERPSNHEGPVHVTLTRKDPKEAMGLDLADMTITGVVDGSAADRSNFGQFKGHMITHVNGTPVRTIEDVGPLVGNSESTKFTLEFDHEMDAEKHDKKHRRRHRSKHHHDKKRSHKDKREKQPRQDDRYTPMQPMNRQPSHYSTRSGRHDSPEPGSDSPYMALPV